MAKLLLGLESWYWKPMYRTPTVPATLNETTPSGAPTLKPTAVASWWPLATEPLRDPVCTFRQNPAVVEFLESQ